MFGQQANALRDKGIVMFSRKPAGTLAALAATALAVLLACAGAASAAVR